MEEIDLKKFAKIAMAKKVYIIIIMIISITIGVIYSYSYITPKYKSTTTLLLAQINENKLDQNTLKQSEITDLSMTSTLLEPYISIIKSKKVLKKVIKNLDLDMTDEELNSILTVSEENTAMLAVSVVSENAEFAAKVANEIANVFTEESHEIFNITNVNIIDKAEVEKEPYNINHIKDLAIFTVLGMFMSCGLILLIYMIDTTIREEEDIEQELNLPVLGIIPKQTKKLENEIDKNVKLSAKKRNDELIILRNAKSPVSEAFRTLRTNITFSQNTKTILITSSGVSDGKSYITANLAAAMAKTGKKILVVDADMRKGRQNRIFGLSNKSGLSNYLDSCSDDEVNVDKVSSYIKTTKVKNLHMITSGSRPSNPSELLTPSKIRNLLSVLREIYDIVLLDGSPSNLISDSIAIGKFVDYTLLITAHKATKIEEAKKVIKSFEQVGGKIKGAVLNKYPLTKEEYMTSYYYEAERNVARLEESGNEPEKSVKELVEESNINSILKEKIKGEECANGEKNVEIAISPIGDTMPSMLEYKVEKIDSEISAMKNILLQFAMNNNNINTKDLELIRYEIKSLKDTIDESGNNSMGTLKKEIEETKELAENIAKTQQSNNEKIKNFIENYYKNKNKPN